MTQRSHDRYRQICRQIVVESQYRKVHGRFYSGGVARLGIMQRRALARRISIAIYGSPRTCRAVLSPLPPPSIFASCFPPRPTPLPYREIRNASNLLFESPLSAQQISFPFRYNYSTIRIYSLLVINRIFSYCYFSFYSS